MNFLKTVVVFFLFSNYLASQEPIIESKGAQPKTILFIGNSYLYYGDSVHNHFRRMVEEYFIGYVSSSVKSATIGGARLKHHNVERLIKAKAISSIEKFNLIIHEFFVRFNICVSHIQSRLRIICSYCLYMFLYKL